MSGRVRLATSCHPKLSPTFHRRRSHRARPLFTRAVALFGALRASVFEARRSPTDFCKLQRRAGTATIDSRFLAGTVTAITFLFFDASRPLPCGSGDARRAALRPFGPASVPVPPGCPGLPDRDVSTVATPSSSCPAEVQCRLTCTGLWTERRTCPLSWRRFLGVCREECVRLAHADHVPLLILPEGTCCHRCGRVTGNEPQPSVTDRPRPKLLRHPAKAAGIPWTRVPSTVAAAGS